MEKLGIQYLIAVQTRSLIAKVPVVLEGDKRMTIWMTFVQVMENNMYR